MAFKQLIAKLAGECAPVVGLDVGQHAVKAIRFERQGAARSRPQAARLDRQSEGIVDDEDLFSHLKSWLHDHGGDGAELVVGIPQEVTTVQITSFPADSLKLLDAMVAFQTHQLADLSDDAFVHDYRLMPGEAGGELPAVIGVCLQSIVGDRLDRYVATGVNLKDFGISSLALVNAYFDLRPELLEDGKVRLLLDIGGQSTTMVVVRNQRLLFCGTLDFGGDAYVAAMAQQWGKGVDDVRQSTRRPHIRPRDQESALGRMGQALVAEIRAGLDYWREQTHAEAAEAIQPGALLLCGGGANLPGLLEFLERSFACDVSLLHVPGVGEAGAGCEFVVAYGLALQAAGRACLPLSMAPPALTWRAKRERRTTVLMAAVAVMAVVLGASLLLSWRNLTRRNDHLAIQLEELTRCQQVIARLDATGEQLRALETVQLPVIEHGNRAHRFARAMRRLGELRGADDWFIYFGDRLAFEKGKSGTLMPGSATRPGGPAAHPFAAPGSGFVSPATPTLTGQPSHPVATELPALTGLVAAGYTRLNEEEPYGAVRELIGKLNRDPFLAGVDLLPANEFLGREDIFHGWRLYLQAEDEQHRLAHRLMPFTLSISFAATDLLGEPEHARQP